MIIIIQISLYFRPLTIRSFAKMWIFQLTSTSAHKSLLATLFLMTPFSLFNFPAKSAAIYLCVTTFPTWLSPAASLFPRDTTIFEKTTLENFPLPFFIPGETFPNPSYSGTGFKFVWTFDWVCRFRGNPILPVSPNLWNLREPPGWLNLDESENLKPESRLR